jgi:hypothetical protein
MPISRPLLYRTAVLTLIAGMSGCSQDSGVYTLYRASPIDPTMRLHMATFDSEDGDAYNGGNCNIAAGLFVSQPGVTVRYWCEKGRYRR